MARASAGERLGRRSRIGEIQRDPSAAGKRRSTKRGLPVPERLDAREIGRRWAAGDGVDLRRRVHVWLRVDADLRRNAVGSARSGGGVVQLSAQRAFRIRASGTEQGI